MGLPRALLDKGDLLSSGDCCQLVNIALVFGAFVTMIVAFTEYLLCVGSASRSLHALALLTFPSTPRQRFFWPPVPSTYQLEGFRPLRASDFSSVKWG